MNWRKDCFLYLILDGGAEPSIVTFHPYQLIMVSDLPASKRLKKVKIGEKSVPMDASKKITYWKNKLEGVKSIMEYTMGIFNCEFRDFAISGGAQPSETQWVLQFLAGRNVSFKRCIFNCNDDTLKSVSYFKNLKFNTNQTGNQKKFLCLPTTHLVIIQGMWLRESHLNSMNCSVLTLQETPFMCKDINNFLKKWKRGEVFSHLRCAFIGTRDEEPEDVMRGLEIIEMFQEERQYRVFKNFVQSIKTGFNIKRKDGVIATVSCFKSGPKNVCGLFVWPDFAL